MKKLSSIFIVLMLVISASNAQNTWMPDKAHSSVNFKIKHMGISFVNGRFQNFEGEITGAADDFSDMSVDFTLDATSVTTDVAQRDEHIKSPDILDVEQFPSIHYVSSSVAKTAENEYDVTGNLTMHGVTKAVTLHVVYLGQETDFYKNVKAGLLVTGIINRYDFGVEYNAPLESGNLLIGKTMDFTAELELVKE